MTEADIGMTGHRSKNTLGRSVPVKTKTDVEEDGTSEDGSPRPVCIIKSTHAYVCVVSEHAGKRQTHAHIIKVGRNLNQGKSLNLKFSLKILTNIGL